MTKPEINLKSECLNFAGRGAFVIRLSAEASAKADHSRYVMI